MTSMEKCDNSMWDAAALSLVEEAVDLRRSLGMFPETVPFTVLMNSAKAELLEALDRLHRRGALSRHENINGIPMFGIKRNDI